MCNSGILPAGLGIQPKEWDKEGYPTSETIKSGKGGKGELEVLLPDDIWRPRAELWCQALSIAVSILEQL